MLMSVDASALTHRPCPICDSTNRRTVLSLPDTPLGDRFCHDSSEAKALKIYPLRVDRCQSCGHSFIPYSTDPEDSYKHYLFNSGKSPGLAEIFSEIISDLLARHQICSDDLILDIGANDGSWLSYFGDIGCSLLGVEPAPTPAAISKSRGIPVINDYFTLTNVLRSGLLTQTPRVISLNYVFANLPNPHEILCDIASLIDDNTVTTVLTGYHPAQLTVSMFDYVYHEHLSYYSCQDLQALAEKAGLTITHCRETPQKGGSLYLEMQKSSRDHSTSIIFETMLKREIWLDTPRDAQWLRVQERLAETGQLVRSSIEEARSKGYRVIGYGASHSTTTLSYALSIESSLDFIIDDNDTRHGLYAPGTGCEVASPKILTENPGALVIILAWQHGPKIVDNLLRLRFQGSVIVPFPSYSKEVFNG